MADQKISQLPNLGASLAANDALAVADTSAAATKKVLAKDLVQYGIALIDAGSIDGDKIDTSSFGIPDNSITAAKLTDNSSGLVSAGAPPAGTKIGQVGFNSVSGELFIWVGGSWASVVAGGSLNSVTGDGAGVSRVAVTTTGGVAALDTYLADTANAGEVLAGPATAGGAAGYRKLVASDIPTATGTVKGGVIVNGSGLAMSGETIQIDNTVAVAGSYSLVTVNAQGLVTGHRQLTAADFPLATASTPGAVMPGPGLSVSGTGALGITNTVTPGTHPKITYDAQGLVTAGGPLLASDVPAPTSIDGAIIVDETVGSAKIADYTVTLIQDTPPGASADYHLGQRWINPLTQQEYMYARGSAGDYWMPIGLTALVADNIRWLGTVDASTGLVKVLTNAGVSEGYVPGSSPGLVTLDRVGGYFIVDVGGAAINELSVVGITLDPGDWLLAMSPTDVGAGTGGWTRIDSMYGGSGSGSEYLDDLLDVDAPTVTTKDKQVLGFDGTTNGWRPYDAADTIDWDNLDWSAIDLSDLWPELDWNLVDMTDFPWEDIDWGKIDLSLFPWDELDWSKAPFPPMALDDLTDVDLSTPPTDGQALIYDGASGAWIPGAGVGGTTDFPLKPGDGLTGGDFDGSSDVEWEVNWGDLDWSKVDMTDFPWGDIDWGKIDLTVFPWDEAQLSIGMLTNVNASADSPADGHTLVWDGANSEWVAKAGGGGGASVLDDLGDCDTTTTAPTNGQVLTWDDTAGKWIPKPAGSPTMDKLTPGNYIDGNSYDGSLAETWDIEADTEATPETLVARDANGSVKVATISALNYDIDSLSDLP
nr:phage-related tail fiber protein [uncultured Mediterranean phage uvMED]